VSNASILISHVLHADDVLVS